MKTIKTMKTTKTMNTMKTMKTTKAMKAMKARKTMKTTQVPEEEGKSNAGGSEGKTTIPAKKFLQQVSDILKVPLIQVGWDRKQKLGGGVVRSCVQISTSLRLSTRHSKRLSSGSMNPGSSS